VLPAALLVLLWVELLLELVYVGLTMFTGLRVSGELGGSGCDLVLLI
jgi:hypothetical protein